MKLQSVRFQCNLQSYHLVQFLLDIFYQSALCVAVENNSVEIVVLLLSNENIDVNSIKILKIIFINRI